MLVTDNFFSVGTKDLAFRTNSLVFSDFCGHGNKVYLFSVSCLDSWRQTLKILFFCVSQGDRQENPVCERDACRQIGDKLDFPSTSPLITARIGKKVKYVPMASKNMK